MRKTCEKHVEKRSMYWQYSTRDILLMFKIHILFLVVYIRLLTFNLNTYFFDILFPLLIKTSPFFRYLGNFQPPPPPLSLSRLFGTQDQAFYLNILLIFCFMTILLDMQGQMLHVNVCYIFFLHKQLSQSSKLLIFSRLSRLKFLTVSKQFDQINKY